MYIIGILGVIVLIAIDRFTKYLAVLNLEPSESITFIKGFMDFTLIKNTGAAFGMLEGARWFFIVLTVLVLAFIIYYYRKIPINKNYNIIRGALVFISAGAIGNFLDRVINGYVTDFFEFTFFSFPVFNVADIFVVCGTFVLAYMMLFKIKD
ncbi:MAG: signal peptidase II [Lachnospiraceae bacterium]|nr:signal peptidase II [Lachnospiraceae bacterium]